MPTPPLEEPTSKVTLNLFTADLAWLRKNEDHWTATVRELVKRYAFARQHSADFIDIRGA